jgi:rod shape-determining protein MreD
MEIIQKVDSALRASFPVVICIVFALLDLGPWTSPIAHAVLDPIPLIILCYWVIHRPDLFPMSATFGVGLLRDALSGQFLGVITFTYLLADFVLRSQRTFFANQPFLSSWMVYGVVLFGTGVMQWGLTSLMEREFLDMVPMLLRVAFGVLLYPLVSGIMSWVQAILGRG